MAEIKDLNVVDDSNVARFPEAQPPSTVNDGARAGEGLEARAFKDTIDTTLVSTGAANAYALTANRNPPDAGPALYNGLTLTFQANHANTGAATLTVTLNTSLQLVKDIVDIAGAALTGGEIVEKAVVTVIFREADDHFMLVSGNAKVGVDLDTVNRWTQQQQWNVGTNIASAATLVIPDDGNSFKVTGAVTITAFSTKPVGTWIWLEFDAALTLEHDGINLSLNNNGDHIAVEAGDRAICLQLTGSLWTVWVMRASGKAIRETSTQIISSEFTSADQTISAAGSFNIPHGLGAAPKILQVTLKCAVTEANWAVGEEIYNADVQSYGGTSISRGIVLTADSSNVFARYGVGDGVNVFETLDKATGVRVTLTNANWRVVVRAYA